MKAGFIGLRPSASGGYNFRSKENLSLGRKIRKVCVNLIENYGVDQFYFGGTLSEQLALMVCLKLKEKYAISLTLAIPFVKQNAHWEPAMDELFETNFKNVDLFYFVDELDDYKVSEVRCGEYHSLKFKKMSEFVVDRSDYLITVRSTDEQNQVSEYAEQKGVVEFKIDTRTPEVIYTSYFGNVKKLMAAGFKDEQFLVISRVFPKGVMFRPFPKLAPPATLLSDYKDGLSWEVFTFRYKKEILSHLDANAIAKDIGKDKILLCYEGREDNCHRHILVDWFENVGITVVEIEQG